MTADTIAMMNKAMADLRSPQIDAKMQALGKTLLVSPGFKRGMLSRMAEDSANPVVGVEHVVNRYMGIPFEVADIPPERVEDWSGCRSPARAKRRAKQGHPQRVKVTFRERAFLVDKAALGRGLMGRFERMAVKMLIGEKW